MCAGMTKSYEWTRNFLNIYHSFLSVMTVTAPTLKRVNGNFSYGNFYNSVYMCICMYKCTFLCVFSLVTL